MIEAKFFTVGTYLYKYNLTVLFLSPSKIAHEKFYIYCPPPPLLLNEIYAHALRVNSGWLDRQENARIEKTYIVHSKCIVNSKSVK